MVIPRTITLLVLLASLAACGSTAPGVHSQPQVVLDPSTFVVTGVTEKGVPKQLVEGTEIRLRFADGKLTLTAGCNTMSAGYTLDVSRLTVGPVQSTEMGCDRERMDQDGWLAKLFDRPVQISTGPDGAVVSGDTVLSIADRKTVSPDKPLIGTTWILDTVYDGDTAASVPSTKHAWIRFGRHGQVHADDGLNDGSGPVSVTGDRVNFGDGLGWTLVGCTSGCPVGDFSGVLSGTARFTIEEDRLTLTQGAHGLGFHAR
jgi:heat shock protein HslJ